MIDNKGKLFGKINIVDLLIVIFVIIAAAATVYKFGFSAHKNVNQSDITLEYVLKTSGVRSYTADSITVGDEIYDAETDRFLGTVSKVEKKEALGHLEKADGRIVYTEKPERFDVHITVECDARLIGGGYFANGTKEIGVFSEIEIYSQDFTCQTEVESVTESK